MGLADDYTNYWAPIERLEHIDIESNVCKYSMSELRYLSQYIDSQLNRLEWWKSWTLELRGLSYLIRTCKTNREFFVRFKQTVFIEEKLRVNINAVTEKSKLFQLMYGPYVSGVQTKNHPYTMILRWRKWMGKE